MIRAIMSGRQSAPSGAVATAGKPTPAAVTGHAERDPPPGQPAGDRHRPHNAHGSRPVHHGTFGAGQGYGGVRRARAARKALKGRTVPGGRVRRVAGR